MREKGLKIKKNKGDSEHKKRTQTADFLPAFLVSILIKMASFISSKLGLSIPALALKKDQFGSGCVTSLGMLNFEDALAPFSGFMNCTFFASVNAVIDAPVVDNGELAVGKIMNVNFVVDHRYVDGGRAKDFVPAFKEVFENP